METKWNKIRNIISALTYLMLLVNFVIAPTVGGYIWQENKNVFACLIIFVVSLAGMIAGTIRGRGLLKATLLALPSTLMGVVGGALWPIVPLVTIIIVIAAIFVADWAIMYPNLY